MAIAGGLLVLFAHGAGRLGARCVAARLHVVRWRGPKADSAAPRES
jgi:hypothetical protein